jgi:hypothetical protein
MAIIGYRSPFKIGDCFVLKRNALEIGGLQAYS